MKCPACGNNLSMTERQGIEIDYCPNCRGIWLDRGELDKLIERSSSWSGPPASAAPAPAAGYAPAPPTYRRRDDDDDDDDYYRRHGHHRKRRGFLGDLFDFD